MTNTMESGIQYSQFIGREVVDHSTGHFLGHISGIWIDLNHHEVMGFNCRAGFWDFFPCSYPLGQVCLIDDQQIAVDPTTELNLPLLSNLLSSNSFVSGDHIDLHVWTESGQWIGEVTDYSFDLGSGEIIDYLCTKKSGAGLIQEQFNIPMYSIVNACFGGLLVSDSVMPLVDEEVVDILIPRYLSTAFEQG
ncbi:PRC-barrel domain-containing protein [Acaryochloris sp. CCMEE 5410]|uniref:PRC-barrel domain-containing protein n=1 Tax=Acaryochloris sp. CCMEE 5410 TaxID=310037 RepID=UPI000300D60D|nr:PRC-barrel domain-containing protein [Acaryochloris sp. CCMEE 5410]KAI9134408.1 PRC-barrel domain-containing protein [Acaryochloris sp. CCMEE 5410]